MGCIPIMKHSLLDPMLDGLPIIFVNNWEEVTQEFLDENLEKIKSSTHNTPKAYFEYWKHLINSYKQR